MGLMHFCCPEPAVGGPTITTTRITTRIITRITRITTIRIIRITTIRIIIITTTRIRIRRITTIIISTSTPSYLTPSLSQSCPRSLRVLQQHAGLPVHLRSFV